MDQFTLNMIFGGILAVSGWLARQLWDAVHAMKADLHRIEVDLPINYVRKDDLDKRMDHIEAIVQRIYDKLDGKADK